MSRKFRKALKDKVRASNYHTPDKGYKLYVLAYGADPLFTYETNSYEVMTKESAFHIINDIREEEHQKPLTNIKKVNYFRVA